MSDESGPVRFRVLFLRIVDGDTIRVLWHGENTAVRLIGINTPERNQPGYREATDCLRILVGDADTVDLEFPSQQPKRDSLGRLLATLRKDGINLNAEMLKRGHAVPYRRPTPVSGSRRKAGNAMKRQAPPE